MQLELGKTSLDSKTWIERIDAVPLPIHSQLSPYSFRQLREFDGMSFRKSTLQTNMDMYIEKDLQKSLVNNLTPGVCYVCGSPNSATHLLRTKPITSEPHFPFLEHHEPPIGCELPKSNGTVVVCFVCYSFLHAQWDSHERNNTPHSTRLYWLKRVDQGPYSGSDGQPAEERQTEASPLSGIPKVQEHTSTQGTNILK